MPLKDFVCECGYKDERIVGMNESSPHCPDCGEELQVHFCNPPMVKMKGEGGYPSRRRQIFNTTKRYHPKLT